MVDVTLIGTGGLMPLPERALASVFLRCQGGSILFDCGEGTQSAAQKAGVSLVNTDLIALTHYHGDHTFGLPGLLQTLQVKERTKPLVIAGPKGIGPALEPLLKAAGELSYEIKLIELTGEPIKQGELIPDFPALATLTPFATSHKVLSCGYVFALERAGKFYPEKAEELGVPVEQWSELQSGKSVETENGTVTPGQVLGEKRKGIKFVFTGDTAQCYNLVGCSENADLLVSEATFGENEHEKLAAERGHMTFAQAAKVAKDANVKQLCLTHFSPRVVNPADYLENATSIFENTVIGEDGMKFTLDFEE
ncbi:MAG: ribonuclease Z [Clostridia bacterium]|nr:ribonuclease Z [Clostridia bacterium]